MLFEGHFFIKIVKKGQVLLLNRIGALIVMVLGLISGILSIEAFPLRSTHV